MSDLILFLSILPGILVAVLVYIYVDKYEKEPTLPIIITFFIGVIVAYFAFKLEEFLSVKLEFLNNSMLGVFVFAFLVVSLVEEGLKYLGYYLYPYHSKYVDEPIDPVIYCVMLSMGFATVENILYGMIYGIETVLIRTFTAIPAHAIFGIFMGYYLSNFYFKNGSIKKLLIGLAIILGIHTLYDYFIIQQISEYLMLGALVVLGVGIFYSLKMIKELQSYSSPAT